MKTIFMNAPFTRHEMGWAPRVWTPQVPERRWLGQSWHQREAAYSVIGDVLSEIGVSEKDINDLLDKIPPTAAGPYRAKFEECKKKGLTTSEGAICAYQLYKEIKAGTPEAPKPVIPPPAPSSFPIIPVAIGVVVAGGLVYFLAKKG
jgi:hypothetical protein